MTPAHDRTDELQDVINNMGLGAPAKDPVDNSANDSNAQQQAQQQRDGAAANTQQFDETLFEKTLNDRFGLDSTALRTRIEEVGSLKQLVDAPVYKSTLGKGFDELVANGQTPENAIKYLTTDLDQMDNREFMALNMTLTTPSISMEEALRHIDKKYGLGDFKKSDDEEKDGLVDLKIATADIRPKAQELKTKMLELGKNRDVVASEQANAGRLTNWNKEIQKMKAELTEVRVPVGLTKEGKPRFEFPFKISNNDPLIKEVQSLVEQDPRLLADEKGVAFVKEIMTHRAIISNLPNLMQAVLVHGRSQNNQFWDTILNNPDFGANGSVMNASSGLGSTDQQIADGIAKALGG